MIKLLSRLFFIGLLMGSLSNPVRAQEEDEPLLGKTYTSEEIMAAAETFFGNEFNEGLARVIEKAIQDNGPPNAYYFGEEDEGIPELGYRYGEGQLFHKDFGRKAVFWRGPSIGFDLVGPSTKTFAVIFNLHDLKSFYKRFRSGETGYYFYKGAALSYRRRLDLTLAQIQIGVEVAEGLNPYWIKFGAEKMVMPNVLPELGDFQP